MLKLLFAVLALLPIVAQAVAGEVDYQRDIKPLLHEKCSACHGAIKQEAGLRLDAGKLVHQGSDGGKVVNIDDVTTSQLLERVRSDDDDLRMPPEGEGERLTPEQVQLLTAWITSGASYPADEATPHGPDAHWAFRLPVKAVVPTVDDEAWAGNPIDAFLNARLQSHGLQPAPLADRRTLLRRVYLDLVGLPPTPEEQQAFLDETSSEAWSRVVDRLLEDEAHGERWARHWMDVWRYSDWDGYKQQLRGSQRHIWRWRDWIIESLNADKPYDRMVVEMLAGDEAAPADRSVLRATGYLARNYHSSNRNIWLDATVEHTAKAFLGITINCARCHDHKYDPITQPEYYALRAIFEPHNVRIERVPGQTDLVKAGFVRAFDAKPTEPTFLYVGGNEKAADKGHPIAPAVPQLVDLPFDPQPIDLPPVAVFPSLRDFYEQEALGEAGQQRDKARDALASLNSTQQDTAGDSAVLEIAEQRLLSAEAELASVSARWNADKARYGGKADEEAMQALAQAASLAERTAALKKAELLLSERRLAMSKAEVSAESDQAKRKAAIDKAKKELTDGEQQLAAAKEKLGRLNQSSYTSVGKSFPTQSTGRRLALAKWITDRRNPLTARVAVNHIWLRHFGEPLVANVFDFGMRSAEPMHRDLVDWLAVEFMESGWSMKHLHHLICTSRYYRTTSHVDSTKFAKNLDADPDNTLLWKTSVRRLDAEVVRDSVLHIAGSLDRTVGEPDIDQSQGAKVRRRSVYFRHAYEKQMPMMVAFDAASPTECYRRSESIVPQQALALSNGPLAIEQSRILAGKLNQSNKSDEAFVRASFSRVLCRACTTDELRACIEFLAEQAKLLSDLTRLKSFDTRATVPTQPAGNPLHRARENLIHVLVNHNDFVTVR